MNIAISNPHFFLANMPNEFPLLKGLTELGNTATIFTSSSIGKRAEFIPKEFIEKGFEEEKRFLFKVRRLNCLFDWRGENPLLPRLSKELEKEDFNIFQSTDYHRFITLGTLKAARQKKKPFIFTAHRQYLPLDAFSAKLLLLATPLFQKKVIDRTDHIIAVSEKAKEFILKLFKYPEDRITVIPQGIDTQLFSPKKKPCANRILCIGRLVDWKGHAVLIQACCLLKKKGIDFFLEIRGRGPEQKNLEELIKKNGLEKNVSINNSFSWVFDMPQVYNSFNVLVHPSLNEVIGLAPLEAMACGLPVVASRVGFLREIIQNEKNSLVFEAANAQQLAEALGSLLLDKNKIKKIGELARKTIVEKLDYKKTAKRHLDVYSSL